MGKKRNTANKRSKASSDSTSSAKKHPLAEIDADLLRASIMSDKNLNDSVKEQLNDILQNITALWTAKVLPNYNENYCNTYTQYADIFINLERFAGSGDTENERICQEMLDNIPIENLEKRLVTTMKRLQEKGYYFDTISFPLSSSKLWNSEEYEQAVYFTEALFNRAGYSKSPQPFKISDDTWLRAIELTIYLHKPELLSDSEFPAFIPTLDANKVTLGHCVLLLALIQEQRDRNMQLILGYQAAGHYYASLKQLEKKHEEVESMRHELQKAKAESDDIRARSEVAVQELTTSTEKQFKNMRHEYSVMLRDKEKERERENAYYRDAIAKLRQQLSDAGIDSADELPAMRVSDTEDLSDVELPDKGVVFLGGHNNTINRLKSIYAHWTYMNSAKYKERNTPQKPIIVFISTNYVGHDDEERISADVPAGTPSAYVSATNLERLLLEMKHEYVKHYPKQDSNAD